MRRALVLGAAGFIGQALCKRLTAEGCAVSGVDIATGVLRPDVGVYSHIDLRDFEHYAGSFDEVYQLAADVGGVAYLSGGHDADVMANNVAINRNVAQWAVGRCGVLVFTSSACVYPPLYPAPHAEEAAFADAPANDYGVEKLFSERLYQAHARDYGLNVRIARLGNVYGPGEPLSGPRAHLVGDLCRKAMAETADPIEVWGNGRQIRSMVYIDDVVDGLIMLARTAENPGPVNIAGTPFSVFDIAGIVAGFENRDIGYVPGPTGAHSSALDISKALHLGWEPKTFLYDGLRATYDWARAA